MTNYLIPINNYTTIFSINFFTHDEKSMVEKSKLVGDILTDLREIFAELEIDFIDEMELSFDKGYSSKIIGYSPEEINYTELEKFAKKFKVDVIGVSYNFASSFAESFEIYYDFDDISISNKQVNIESVDKNDSEILEEKIDIDDSIINEL